MVAWTLKIEYWVVFSTSVFLPKVSKLIVNQVDYGVLCLGVASSGLKQCVEANSVDFLWFQL